MAALRIRMSTTRVAWFLGVVSLTQTFRLAAPPQPPSWPPAFSVSFHEESHFWIVPTESNAGAWYYDFGNRRARFDHLQGQHNNFCQGRGLKLKDGRGDCHLIFNHTDMYVHYPREQQCCRACGAAEGCTVLKPTWMEGAKYLGTESINGTVCHGWEKHGAVAADRWYQTEDGTPCRYSEVYQHWPHPTHNITFHRNSYKVGNISATVFDVPKYCKTRCPFPFKNAGF